MKNFLIFIILYFIFAVPIALIVLGVLIFKAITNFKNAREEFLKKFGGNFLRITIFMPNRQITSFYVTTITDYFKYDDGEYFINEKSKL